MNTDWFNKNWKQPNWPFTGDWLNRTIHVIFKNDIEQYVLT